MKTNKRFLILTSDSGFGHRSAAKSVLKALEVQYPDQVECLIINPILETDLPKFMKQIDTGYDKRIKSSPQFYRFTYEISDSRPVSEVLEGALTLALQKNIRQLIGDVQPDAILSTNQMFNSPTGAVLKDLDKPIPFFTAVTDMADVHSLWFGNAPDRFFVASDWVKIKAVENGIPERKITISGIPVDPEFMMHSQQVGLLREKLGLKPGVTTILFVGSVRVDNIKENLEALEKVACPIQVVVITGGDHDLFTQLSGIEFGFPLYLQDFVTNMPEWMLASDVLITKAGGLILSEGLAAGLPIVIIDYLPGQEEGNVRFVLGHQAGSWVQNPEELTSTLDYWLCDGQKRLRMVACNARDLGHPDSALTIASALWDASEPHVDQPIPEDKLE
ncbi:MAG: glycosyltransferase [Anaerolineaceae bacterium]